MSSNAEDEDLLSAVVDMLNPRHQFFERDPRLFSFAMAIIARLWRLDDAGQRPYGLLAKKLRQRRCRGDPGLRPRVLPRVVRGLRGRALREQHGPERVRELPGGQIPSARGRAGVLVVRRGHRECRCRRHE